MILLEQLYNEEALKTLGKKIRTIRLQKKLRQLDVSRRCGIYSTGYNSIEAGVRNISILTLYKIAFALEEPIGSFFDDESFKQLLEKYPIVDSVDDKLRY